MANTLANELDQPLSTPPSGEKSDFGNSATNRVFQLYIVVGICLSLILIFAIARFFAKWKILKRKSWDDSQASSPGTLKAHAIRTACMGRVFGYHEWDVSIADFTTAHAKSRLVVLTGLFYFASMMGFIILCTPRHGQSELDYLAAFDSPNCLYHDQSLSILGGAVNMASDVFLIILPLPAVWSLQMPFKKKGRNIGDVLHRAHSMRFERS
ncbi:hypothetical protein EV356DRAFT_513178 [Viridothelium virens]|uniref:Rhodopsin domain-containing protein n=1 Tax=Viridothelium virens TaxID=1048519 RepID=A0A6A6HDP1_VIRVR|nr:hypothetical protein EV356DRAFT_513178 [Viridothelium virens]